MNILDEIPHIYIGSCVKEKEERIVSLMKTLGIRRYTVIHTERIKPGRVGCWNCHRMMAKQAIEDGRDIYITLEEASTATDNFSFEAILDCRRTLEKNREIGLIMLSRYYAQPLDVSKVKISNYVWMNYMRKVENTQAMMLTKEFGKFILDCNLKEKGIAIDNYLASIGRSRVFCYPSCFRRIEGMKSLTTPKSNTKFFIPEDFVRRKKVYNILEYVNQNSLIVYVGVIILSIVYFLLIYVN